MERSKPNPLYRDAKMEIGVWTPETGAYVLREVRRKGDIIYLRGRDERGQVHYEVHSIPFFDAKHWLGDTEVRWK